MALALIASLSAGLNQMPQRHLKREPSHDTGVAIFVARNDSDVLIGLSSSVVNYRLVRYFYASPP